MELGLFALTQCREYATGAHKLVLLALPVGIVVALGVGAIACVIGAKRALADRGAGAIGRTVRALAWVLTALMLVGAALVAFTFFAASGAFAPCA